MVIYDNKRWVEALINFHRSYVIRTVYRSTLIVGLFTAVLCFLLIHAFRVEVNFNSSVFQLLGIALSILLSFRTNTAYDRWYEGRKLWGTLVNTSRNFALNLHALLDRNDQENRAFFARHIANFAFALKEHLRDGVKLDELYHLSDPEKLAYQQQQHIPNYITGLLYERTQALHRAQVISGYDSLPIKDNLRIMLDVLGGCERIKKTPIPFSYSIYIKTFVLAYTLILPFGLIEEFGYFTIPLVMLVFFAFVGLELMAEEIEDPFGKDCNDLPTGDIAKTIKNNTYEILYLFGNVEKDQETQLYEKVF